MDTRLKFRVISSKLNADKIVAVPLDVEDTMELGILQHDQRKLSKAERFLHMLKTYFEYGFEVQKSLILIHQEVNYSEK